MIRAQHLFYPILKPVLERGIDEIAVEEVRKVCQHSLDTLLRVSSEAAQISDNVMSHAELRACIEASCVGYGITEIVPKLFIHMASCCEGLVQSNNRKREDWNQCLEPIFKK